MGFNTVAVLFNDCTHEFAKDGPLGKRIADAMRNYSHKREGLSAWFGAGQVVSQAHADYTQIVAVGRNGGEPVADATKLDWYALEQMKRCLENHGYKVTKPRRTKPTLPNTAKAD